MSWYLAERIKRQRSDRRQVACACCGSAGEGEDAQGTMAEELTTRQTKTLRGRHRHSVRSSAYGTAWAQCVRAGQHQALAIHHELVENNADQRQHKNMRSTATKRCKRQRLPRPVSKTFHASPGTPSLGPRRWAGWARAGCGSMSLAGWPTASLREMTPASIAVGPITVDGALWLEQGGALHQRSNPALPTRNRPASTLALGLKHRRHRATSCPGRGPSPTWVRLSAWFKKGRKGATVSPRDRAGRSTSPLMSWSSEGPRRAKPCAGSKTALQRKV